MRHPTQRDENDRFNGPLRHYHRAGSQTHRTWDEWVEGKPSGSKPSIKWLKITFIITGILSLGGIVVGLVVELW